MGRVISYQYLNSPHFYELSTRIAIDIWESLEYNLHSNEFWADTNIISETI